MRQVVSSDTMPLRPLFATEARTLAEYIQTLSLEQLTSVMRISSSLAKNVADTYSSWSQKEQSLAIDSFIGDIYSGLRASTLDPADREYANAHLWILSGLYGILRPFDDVSPYRLEMAYRLPDKRYTNLYTFWGDKVAKALPDDSESIVNLAAVEYSRLITPFIDTSRIITPRFLTVNEKTHEPVFVVVHAKIARGAFARWLITSRITSIERLREFSDIGYSYDSGLSTPSEPVFVCNEFGGIGLSMRLEKA
ncbi:MAG: hypothetical protein JWP06_383 [Candidatus Saccharibacteria bacterium]|nr:hypothetical protein [Candidatus Saccharibacteria bacterium]